MENQKYILQVETNISTAVIKQQRQMGVNVYAYLTLENHGRTDNIPSTGWKEQKRSKTYL